MGRNNRKEYERKYGDHKQRFALRKVRQGVASVLVGATVFGVGAGVVQAIVDTSDHVVLEAAETGAQIIAFDYFILEDEQYNYNDNVHAYEVVDGVLYDLTADVTVLVSTPSVDGNSYEVTYSIVGADGQEVSTVATVTTGVNYRQALDALDGAADVLASEIAALGADNESIDAQFVDINNRLEAVRALHDEYVLAVEEQDANIDELTAQKDEIKEEIATIMRAITYALSDVAEIQQDVDDNTAFLTDEITRLEAELATFQEDVDARVAAMEEELPEKASVEEVDALNARIDAYLAETKGVADTLSAQLATLNALYEDVVSGSMERDEAMLELISIQEDRIDELSGLLESALTDSESEIARLQAELETKVDPSEIAELEAQLETMLADKEASEGLLEEQLLAAEEQNALLNDRINGYEALIAALETEMDLLDTEMSVLERILEALELGNQPVDETPGEEDPVEEEPSDDDPVDEDTPVDEDPTEEDPVDEDTPVDEEPTDEDPVDEDTPVDEEPTDENPVDEDTPVDEVPVDETPVDEDIPVDEEPTDETPVDENLPEDEVPIDETPVDEVPVEDDVPVDENGAPIEDGAGVVDDDDGNPVDVIVDGDGNSVDVIVDEDGNTVDDTGADNPISVGGLDLTSAGIDTTSSDDVGGPDTPISSGDAVAADSGDDAATPSAASATGEDGAEAAVVSAEESDELPQTGSGFGAYATAGIGSLSALGAGVLKLLRRRK